MDFNSFLGYAQINLNSSLLYCVVWEGVFGGGLSPFSWGWENRVSCTVLLSPLSRLSILKQREQLQVRRMKQLCWWVGSLVFISCEALI